jgi:glycolate oxidase iron-sulfur subunit
MTPWWQRAGYRVLTHHRLLLLGSTLLAFAQRLRLVPKRLGLPRLALRRGAVPEATGDDAWLFTGCVMDAWQRDTHRNTAKVLTALGVDYRLPGSGADCCGALHIHAGLAGETQKLAEKVMRSMPGDAPIVVNSAGCGAAMKDYGHLLDSDEARRFSARVRDASEFVAPLIDSLPVRRRVGAVAVQDPCHLRHVQRAHLPVRTVLERVADVVELDDDGLCCGAGGAYSTLQPELAGEIRDRKLAAIERSGVAIVASANPGCALHLAAAGVDVRHPMDIVAEAL